MTKTANLKSRHCYFMIKDGKPESAISHSADLLISSIKIKYNYFDCPTTDIIVEAAISLTDNSAIIYKTIISLIHFPEKREFIEYEINDFMEKIKWEFKKYLKKNLSLDCVEFFDYNTYLDKDLKFDNYKFSPVFSIKRLQEFDY